DTIVSGAVMGRLIPAESLEKFRESRNEKIVALLRRAEGDEEIPAGVRAIVLAHPIPHLSHLGIRARQGGVILVACEEQAEFERLKPLAGKWVTLDAGAQGFKVEPSPEMATRSAAAVHRRRALPGQRRVRLSTIELA